MAQECSVCGQSFGLTHTCPGSPVGPEFANEWLQPKGFAPLFYFRQAVAIARFEDDAIVAASRCNGALAYGAIFWLISRVVIYGMSLLPFFRAVLRGYSVPLSGIGMAIAIYTISDGVVMLVQYAISHGLARWWFGARGTYIGILRATLLGSIVTCAYPIPYVGMLVAGIWSTAILMCVFEQVDGIERMKAFALSYGIGIAFFILSLELSTPRH